jgi:phage/plasmid primase-like uncharacterized protein
MHKRLGSFEEQIAAHVAHLVSEGFDITAEIFESGIDNQNGLKCRSVDQNVGQKGKYWLKTTTKLLDRGDLVIGTVYRASKKGIFQTFSPNTRSNLSINFADPQVSRTTDNRSILREEAHKEAYGYWVNSYSHGSSKYLTRKDVGSYGIRFWNKNGGESVVIVPMYNTEEKLINVQRIFPDGVKRFLDDSSIDAFHIIGTPVDGKPIGIAESYVTAATCYELAAIPIACAFSSSNIVMVAQYFLRAFPASKIIIFADNDRHLPHNIGINYAKKAANIFSNRSIVAIPEFGDIPASKDSTDWNDLVRLLGQEKSKEQLLKFLCPIQQT